jgi:hypothetical protein
MRGLSSFSLRLISKGKVMFESDRQGIRPLLECVIAYRGKIAGCTLQDKVVGLAAARLIVYSGFIQAVETPLVSEKAKTYLQEKGIAIQSEATADSIMNKDRSAQCPMESLAERFDDDSTFFTELRKRLSL